MEATIGDRLTVELDDGRVVEGRLLGGASSSVTSKDDNETAWKRLLGDPTELEAREFEWSVQRLKDDLDHMERTLKETNAYLRERNRTAR